MSDNASAFHSHEYNAKIRKTIPYYDAFYKPIISVVKAKTENPLCWLDVGCGTGRMADEVFHNIAVKRFVFCDNSQKMIELVKKQHTEPCSEFMNISVLDIKEKECFDIVTAIQVFHYLSYEERIRAIRNCLNALCKNGIFIYFENFRPKNEVLLPLYFQRWKDYQLSQGKPQEEADRHLQRYGKDYFLITIDEHIKILADCGFRYSEIIWLSNMQVGIMGIK